MASDLYPAFVSSNFLGCGHKRHVLFVSSTGCFLHVRYVSLSHISFYANQLLKISLAQIAGIPLTMTRVERTCRCDMNHIVELRCLIMLNCMRLQIWERVSAALPNSAGDRTMVELAPTAVQTFRP